MLRISRDDAAAILSTRPEVITALEADDFVSLPPWPETVRIVKEFTGLAGIDAGPMLTVLQAHLVRYDVYARHDATLASAVGAGAVAGAATVESEGASRGLGTWLARSVGAAFPSWTSRIAVHPALRWGVPMTAIFAGVLALTQATGLQASVSQLPPPLARWVMSAQDFLLAQIYPRRDGFVWIEVANPRSRRGDKLKVNRK